MHFKVHFSRNRPYYNLFTLYFFYDSVVLLIQLNFLTLSWQCSRSRHFQRQSFQIWIYKFLLLKLMAEVYFLLNGRNFLGQLYIELKLSNIDNFLPDLDSIPPSFIKSLGHFVRFVLFLLSVILIQFHVLAQFITLVRFIS